MACGGRAFRRCGHGWGHSQDGRAAVGGFIAARRLCHIRPLPRLRAGPGRGRSVRPRRRDPPELVSPFGVFEADPAQGTMMGNRGCLVNAQGDLVRRWQVERWITCALEFKGRRRQPLMAPGRYTELFFLDEATACAAGHRPCHESVAATRRSFSRRGVRCIRATGGSRRSTRGCTWSALASLTSLLHAPFCPGARWSGLTAARGWLSTAVFARGRTVAPRTVGRGRRHASRCSRRLRSSR